MLAVEAPLGQDPPLLPHTSHRCPREQVFLERAPSFYSSRVSLLEFTKFTWTLRCSPVRHMIPHSPKPSETEMFVGSVLEICFHLLSNITDADPDQPASQSLQSIFCGSRHCTPCAEDYHTGSRVLARNTPCFTVTKGGCSFQAPHPSFCRLHHCPLSLGSCQLTSKLLMLSGEQSHSVSWGMKAECPLWVSGSGSWERTDFRGTGKKHLFPTHSHTECHLQTLDSLHFLLDQELSGKVGESQNPGLLNGSGLRWLWPGYNSLQQLTGVLPQIVGLTQRCSQSIIRVPWEKAMGILCSSSGEDSRI